MERYILKTNEFYCYEDMDVEENTDNWYKNKAGQWVCVGDEDEDD